MNLKTSHLQRATAATVVVALVFCQGFVTGTPLTQVVSKLQHYVTGASTAKALRLPATAHLSANGAVTLNGNSAPTGATVFSGAGVKTAENSSATLSFGAAGQVELSSASDFTLALDGTTLGGQLRAGSATIVAPAGIAVKIMTADGPVETNGKDAVVLTVDVTGGKTHVKASSTFANIKTPANAQITLQDTVSQQVKLTPAEQLEIAKKMAERASELSKKAGQALDAAKKAKDKMKEYCIQDKLTQINAGANTLGERLKLLEDAVKRGDTDRSNQEFAVITVLRDRMSRLDAEMSQCVGQEVNVDTQNSQVIDPSPDSPFIDPSPDFPLVEVVTSVVGFVIGAVIVEEVANDTDNNVVSPTRPGQ